MIEVRSAKRIDCVEGELLRLTPPRREALRRAAETLRRKLKLRLPPLLEDAHGCRIHNLVGAIDLGDGTVLHVRPKTRPGDDWVAAVLSLLAGSDPVDIAGERTGGRAAPRDDLLEALARAYTGRLERALHRDGPLQVMQREERRSATLSGRLDVTRWLRDALVHPARFPVATSRLAADNDYSRALCFVAHTLAKRTSDLSVGARLRAVAAALRPGAPEVAVPPAGVELRALPSQWAVYTPAWSIACAVLARRSLLRPEGADRGVSIAIEPWPLLERLLELSLGDAAAQARRVGRPLVAKRQHPLQILSSPKGGARSQDPARPDAVLFEDREAVATFEAKYRDYRVEKGPERTEVYQALAAARAASAPTAVLVYPNGFPAATWSVERPGSAPSRLCAVGLEMFSYRAGGEEHRGAELMGVLS